MHDWQLALPTLICDAIRASCTGDASLRKQATQTATNMQIHKQIRKAIKTASANAEHPRQFNEQPCTLCDQ